MARLGDCGSAKKTRQMFDDLGKNLERKAYREAELVR
jgi:hypothetical protein